MDPDGSFDKTPNGQPAYSLDSSPTKWAGYSISDQCAMNKTLEVIGIFCDIIHTTSKLISAAQKIELSNHIILESDFRNPFSSSMGHGGTATAATTGFIYFWINGKLAE